MGLFEELKRRNVIRVSLAYLIAGWLVLQVIDVLADVLELPDVLGRVVFILLAIGFLFVVIFAWAFELTPEGIKRESEVDRSRSITGQTGRRLNVVIIVLLALVAGYFAWEARFKPDTPDTAAAESANAPIANSPASPPAASLDERASIAVLPFANMSAEAENEYFADGLSEEILNKLARVPDLRVIARTSSFAFKGENRDLREIGDILGARHVLEGSVRRQGDEVRVTAQLIETEDGSHLWSDTWDRQFEDVFAIQDEVAESVVEALNIVLDEASRRAMHQAGVRDAEAFIAYQRGYEQYIDAHGTAELHDELRAANAWFDRAIEAEPGFADAYARKTDLYAHLVLEDGLPADERAEALDEMLALWEKAYELARDPARRRAIDIDRTFFSDDWSRLPALLQEAFASDSCADGNWMEMAMPFGLDAGLERYYANQVRCNPLMLLNYGQLASVQLRQGHLSDAEATLARGRAVGGDHRWLRSMQQMLNLAAGRAETALAELEEAAATQASTARTAIWRYFALAQMGRADEARDARDEIFGQEAADLNLRIQMHAALGEREQANRAAAELDARAGGATELLRVVNYCDCGAPFDLSATPNLAARIESAGFDWPPEPVIQYPAKDW